MRHALELALTFAPFGMLVVLLAGRRFPGERLIVARRERARMRLRPVRVRWSRPAPAAIRSTLLERSPLCRRGPPVAA